MDQRLASEQSKEQADDVPRDGSVEVSPWHVGDHDQLREDDDKYQVRTQFEETVDGWNSEGQGDGDSAGANDGDFHAIAQFFLRGIWSENDLVDVSDKHGGGAKDGGIGRRHDSGSNGSKTDESNGGRRHVLKSHGEDELCL